MGRPRTNRPWIEIRGRQARAYWRTAGGGRAYEAFATREDAEKFRDLVDVVGLDDALGWVRGAQPAADTPTPDTPWAGQPSLDTPAPGTAAVGQPSAFPACHAPAGFLGASEQLRPGQPTGIPFALLADRYLSQQTGLDEKTLDDYATKVRLWLLPYFGNTDIGLILSREPLTPTGEPYKTVAGWLEWMKDQHTHNARGKVTDKKASVNMQRKTHALLYSIFQVALDDPMGGVLLRNPCQHSKLPTAEQPEQDFFQWRHIQLLRTVLRPHWLPLMLFLVLTGVRYGEAAGLTARHIHLHPETGRPYVDIVRAMRWVKRKGRTLGRLKSVCSRRRITLPAVIASVLEPLLEGKTGDDLVFVTELGYPLHHSNFTRRVLIPALRAAHELDETVPVTARLHAFRHTHASLVLANEPNLYKVQRRLGHKSIETTTHVYGHLIDGSSDQLLEALDRIAAGFTVDDGELDAVTALVMELPDPTAVDLPEFDLDDSDDLAAYSRWRFTG